MTVSMAIDGSLQSRPAANSRNPPMHAAASHRDIPMDAAVRWLDIAPRFSATGGLMTGAELMRQMRHRWTANGLVHPTPDPVTTLARWVAAGTVLSIESPWGHLLPAFQFDPAIATTHPAMRPLLQLLRPVFDDAELALWFVTPNDWLGDQCPATAMHVQLSLVLMAARLDRHVACGNSATAVGAAAHRRQ